MTEATLPVLGGGERELRDGDRVRLRCGIDETICECRPGDASKRSEVYPWFSETLHTYDGRQVHWRPDGTEYHEAKYLDIVMILGPAEETHGDGTVTKLCTLPVTLSKLVWATHEPRSIVTASGCTMNDLIYTNLNLRPKPTPSPTYTEKLIEAVKNGEVVLPPRATNLAWHHNLGADGKGMWFCYRDEISPRQNWQWSAHSNGPLPPWQPGDETSIDLATVREAAEVGK